MHRLLTPAATCMSHTAGLLASRSLGGVAACAHAEKSEEPVNDVEAQQKTQEFEKNVKNMHTLILCVHTNGCFL